MPTPTAFQLASYKYILTNALYIQRYEYFQEFIEKASHLLEDQDTISRLTQNASEHLSQNHTAEAEEAAYISAIQRALNNKG